MANIGSYNPNDHEASASFDLIPAGWYAMQIIDSDVRVSSKNAESRYLWLELEMIEAQHPKFSGRKVWATINLWNVKPEVVDIANREMKSICAAIGIVGELTDSEALHHKPLAVKIGIQPAKGDYEASNKTKAFDSCAARASSFGGSAPSTQPMAAPGTAQPAQQPAAQAKPAAAPPWAK